MLKKYTNSNIISKQKCAKCGKSVKVGYVVTDENEVLCETCKQENANDK